MKKTFVICLIMSVLLTVLCSCGNSQENLQDELLASATYTEDTELGTGDKSIVVEVKVMESTVSFKINTDKETLGDALIEHELISGEPGPYGLYVKQVNGITADYDANQSYWSLSKNGEYVATGVDGAEISDGEHYELTYTK